MPRDARGRFLPGPDKDRHKLTRRERSRGYWNAIYAATDAGAAGWVWRRVRGYYRARRSAAG